MYIYSMSLIVLVLLYTYMEYGSAYRYFSTTTIWLLNCMLSDSYYYYIYSIEYFPIFQPPPTSIYYIRIYTRTYIYRVKLSKLIDLAANFHFHSIWMLTHNCYVINKWWPNSQAWYKRWLFKVNIPTIFYLRVTFKFKH